MRVHGVYEKMLVIGYGRVAVIDVGIGIRNILVVPFHHVRIVTNVDVSISIH